jgi:hypothetical protein
MSQKSEEIDLINVFNSIKVIVVKLVSTFLYIIKDSIFSFKRLFALLSICLIIGIGLFFVIKPAYKSQMIIEHKRLNNDQCAELINVLFDISKDKQFKSLAKKLNISEEEALNIKSINYLPLNERIETLLEDSTKVSTPFKIEAKVFNNSILPALEKGILSYLTSNEFVISREKAELDYIDKMDKQIDTQICSLDSLKSKIIETLKPKVQTSGVYINQTLDPVNIYLRELDLYKTKFDLQKNKQLNSSFEIVQGFTENDRPYNSDIKYNIIFSVLIAYCISLLVSLYYNIAK